MKIFSKRLLFIILLTFIGVNAAVTWAGTNAPISKVPPVQIIDNQLYVDGSPFLIRGICYNPVPKGKDMPWGLITQNPTDEDLLRIEKDFQMMHSIGINTLRVYKPITDKNVLNLLHRYHLYVIVPLQPGYDQLPEQTEEIIQTLKDDPSTLAWEIGNEWNYNNFYSNISADTSLDIGWQGSLDIIKNDIKKVHQYDQYNHPIGTSLGELPWDPQQLNDIANLNVDFYGINVYRGSGFGDLFQRWSQLTTKPLYLSEFGLDAYNGVSYHQDLRKQAQGIDHLLMELEGHLSLFHPKEQVLGGALFEWCDEWWKPPKPDSSDLNTHDVLSASSNEDNAPTPRFSEQWFGIVTIFRECRPAYRTLQKYFLQWKADQEWLDTHESFIKY